MKRKIFSSLFALALTLSFSLIPAVPAIAATINVPANYTTIQAAINAASPGDTIVVAAGTYEEQITINKSLCLIGAGESTTTIKAPAGRTGNVVQGSTWDYIVAAYPTTGTIDVKIEGFTIDANNQPKKGGTDGLVGVFFRNVNGTTAGLFDSTIQGFEQVEYQSWGVRVYGDSSLTIDDNTLTGAIPGMA